MQFCTHFKTYRGLSGLLLCTALYLFGMYCTDSCHLLLYKKEKRKRKKENESIRNVPYSQADSPPTGMDSEAELS